MPKQSGRSSWVRLKRTSALGLSLAGLVALWSNAALANDECGAAPGGGLVLCPVADYPNGITYDAGANDLSIVVPDASTIEGGVNLRGGSLSAILNGVSITTSDAFDAGVALDSISGDLTIAAQSIATSGDRAEGIVANAAAGAISITNGVKGRDGDISTLGSLSDGISAHASGDIGIASDAIHTFGNGSSGIHAISDGGSISISSTQLDTHGAAATGMIVSADSGVTIDSIAISTSGKYSEGISASAAHGDIAITSVTVDTSDEFATAITATATDGSVSIDSGAIHVHDHYSRGIVARAGQDITIVSGDISTNSPSFEADGILAYAHGILTIDAQSISVYGSHSYGIVGYGDLGVTIHAGDISTDHVSEGGYAARSSGVVGISYGGDVEIVVQNTNTHGFGIYGQSDAGAVTISAAEVAAQGDLGFGIVAEAQGYYGGDVTIATNSVVTNGYGGFGVYAQSGAGDILLDVGSVTTSGLFSFGISAAARDGGDIFLSGDIVTTNGNYSGAVSTNAYGGSVNVNISSIETNGDFSQALSAYSGHELIGGLQTFGDINIQVDHIETTGLGAYGLFALANAGDINVGVGDLTTRGNYSTGIKVIATTVGNPGNVYFHPGDVTLSVGSVHTDGTYAGGVFAGSTAGNVTIDVGEVVTSGDFATGVVGEADYFGIEPYLYAGGVVIHAGSVATAGANATGIVGLTHDGDIIISAGPVHVTGADSIGIAAQSYRTGDIAITLTGDVQAAHGAAIIAGAAGAATITIGASSNIFGGTGGIFASSNDGVIIDNYGDIRSGNGLAILALGGPATLNNHGTMQGFVVLGDGDDQFNNFGAWEIFGDATFGSGLDALDNFGVVSLGAHAGSVRIAWTGLESFNNAGAVDMANGQAGDVLDLGASAFHGGSGSTLSIDVGATPSGMFAADKVIAGALSGATLLSIRGDGALGSVTVVDGASSSDNAFSLRGGEVDTGLVRITLAFDPMQADWNLIGVPDHEAFETVRLGAAAQGLWRRGERSWSSQMQQQRAGGGESDTFRFWSQGHGGSEDQDGAHTIDVGRFGGGLNTETRWGGAQFGAETHRGAATYGATVGVVHETMKFTADGNNLRLHGVNAGLYGAWSAGGLFVDGLADVGSFDADVNLDTAHVNHTLHGRTWGAAGEAGYHFAVGAFSVDPTLGLSWTRASVSDLSDPATNFHFNTANSFEGLAGARVSSAFGSGSFTWRPSFGLYAVQEFAGHNTARLTTGASGFDAEDVPAESYGKADFGLSAGREQGLQVFVSGEADFGGLSGLNGEAGVRWAF